jgi:hypothetical protein
MINIKPHECLILVTGSHELIFRARPAVSGFQTVENQLVRSSDEDQILVQFSYCIAPLGEINEKRSVCE